MKVKPGDWVRWMLNGELIIGVVAYRRQPSPWREDYEAVTDRGCVNEAHILEVRSAKEE